MAPPSRKKVKPPTNDMRFNHHEASEKAPPHQAEQDLNQASKTMHNTTRTSTHRSIPPSYATSNATLDETILERHRQLRRFLNDAKAEIQRREAAEQNGQPVLDREIPMNSDDNDDMPEPDSPNDQSIDKSDLNSAQMQTRPRRTP